MVKLKPFSTDIEAPSSGPCEMIAEEMRDSLEEMVRLTDETGKEHAAIVVESDNTLRITEIESGDETSMNAGTMAALRMKATEMASDIQGVESVSIGSYKTHQIHTHPKGHLDMSLRDVESIIESLDNNFPANGPVSNLVLVDTGTREVMLGGLYMDTFPTEEQVSEAKAQLRGVEAIMGDQYTRTSKKRELLQRMTDLGYKACSTTFNVS